MVRSEGLEREGAVPGGQEVSAVPDLHAQHTTGGNAPAHPRELRRPWATGALTDCTHTAAPGPYCAEATDNVTMGLQAQLSGSP